MEKKHCLFIGYNWRRSRLASPKVMDYYPYIGFGKSENVFLIPRKSDLAVMKRLMNLLTLNFVTNKRSII
ncbi:hypothetical protein ABET51_20940 [Metabacillus fastidiosus]|uniref:hypothetical protein n=1 Tax=Metabacillus fastidiosus TaxID=1458 RepID=UPI003D2B5186